MTRYLLLLASACMLTACAGIQPVQPWEKGNLAKPEMTFDWSRAPLPMTRTPQGGG